jgi:multiple sugar transport system ATP-binding protein
VASVTLQGLTKSYAHGALKAVDNLDLEIADGEFLVLVGPSGCGKSTALRMIAGLEEISDGGVWIGDEFVNDVHPKDRNIAMVFQNYALYPHLTVFDNIAFPLQIARLGKREIRSRVEEAARILELTDYLRRRPGQLSGGQRQRVAMGRAIVRKPAVFLMDEPLSNLDAKLRVQMRAEIARLQHRLGTTTIYVTHDQVEAMTMGDRVALLKDGVLQQVDSPAGIYDRPKNMFVAAFIGSPSMNLFWADLLTVSSDHCLLRFGGNSMRLPVSLLVERPALGGYVGRSLVVGIRPEDIEDARQRADIPVEQRICSIVDLVESLGSDTILHFGLDARSATVKSSDSLDIIREAGSATPASRCIARLSARSSLRIGEPVELAIDVARMQFFDGQTGAAIC